MGWIDLKCNVMRCNYIQWGGIMGWNGVEWNIINCNVMVWKDFWRGLSEMERRQNGVNWNWREWDERILTGGMR